MTFLEKLFTRLRCHFGFWITPKNNNSSEPLEQNLHRTKCLCKSEVRAAILYLESLPKVKHFFRTLKRNISGKSGDFIFIYSCSGKCRDQGGHIVFRNAPKRYNTFSGPLEEHLWKCGKSVDRVCSGSEEEVEDVKSSWSTYSRQTLSHQNRPTAPQHSMQPVYRHLR